MKKKALGVLTAALIISSAVPSFAGTWVGSGNDYTYRENNVNVTNRWVKSGTTWYYLKADGKMAHGESLTIDGANYSFYNDGSMKTGWMQDGNKWYYFASSGAMVKNDWVRSGSRWYFMDENGIMVSNVQKTIKGVRYAFEASGAMVAGWGMVDGSWYYASAGGVLISNQWVKSGTTWYYLKADGKMAHGESLTIDGANYSFYNDGSMKTGWMQDGNKWYYFASSGAMVKNDWVYSSKDWYYMDNQGMMVTNTSITDKGVVYTFDASGKLSYTRMQSASDRYNSNSTNHNTNTNVNNNANGNKVWVVDKPARTEERIVRKMQFVNVYWYKTRDGKVFEFVPEFDEREYRIKANQQRRDSENAYDSLGLSGNMVIDGRKISADEFIAKYIVTGFGMTPMMREINVRETVTIPEEGHWEER